LNRCVRLWIVIPCLAALCVLAASCDYSASNVSEMPAGTLREVGAPGGVSSNSPGGASPAASAAYGEREAEKAAILDNVVKLIQSAAVKPGGDNFGNATKNLNHYFAGTPSEEYELRPEARAFMTEALVPVNEALAPVTRSATTRRPDELQSPNWAMPDARHIEDCMLYHGIAARVAGTGDDLTRARRVFEWMVRQVHLVPAGSLAAPGLGQAYARPFDVLLRGMATEADMGWSERGWLFLSLCRQLGLDGALLTYTPRGQKDPVVWCTAILIDKTPYLFDARIGLPVPDAKGNGVATLDQALSDPLILDRLDLPGQSPYPVSRASLLASPSKIGVLLDSSFGYFAPRMRLLQRSLSGKDLTVLYRDPAEQRDRWAEALGPRKGNVGLWDLPVTVETMLFNSAEFVRSTQQSLFFFQPQMPLLYARMKQLRGETTEAIEDYVNFRFATNATLTDKKTPMPADIQKVLDTYATYFLGTCHLDRHNAPQAEFFFSEAMKMYPRPGPGQPYHYMYRLGAQTNLARLKEARGDLPTATAYYALDDPTSQRHGNLLRARDLIWRDPTAPSPTLPPPPTAGQLPGAQAAAQVGK